MNFFKFLFIALLICYNLRFIYIFKLFQYNCIGRKRDKATDRQTLLGGVDSLVISGIVTGVTFVIVFLVAGVKLELIQ